MEDILENIGDTTLLPAKGNRGEVSKEEATKDENQCEARDRGDNSGCAEEGGNELKRKLTNKSDEPPAKSPKISELASYLSEPLAENGSSLLYWKSAERFPKLQAAAKKLLAVPATSGGFDRLCPMASCIVKAKRNHLPTHTSERLLLYKNLLNTKTVKKPLAKS